MALVRAKFTFALLAVALAGLSWQAASQASAPFGAYIGCFEINYIADVPQVWLVCFLEGLRWADTSTEYTNGSSYKQVFSTIASASGPQPAATAVVLHCQYASCVPIANDASCYVPHNSVPYKRHTVLPLMHFGHQHIVA